MKQIDWLVLRADWQSQAWLCLRLPREDGSLERPAPLRFANDCVRIAVSIVNVVVTLLSIIKSPLPLLRESSFSPLAK
jgi:hypothetical protein